MGEELIKQKQIFDLREQQRGIPPKTQADHLPTFMKTAKNRERIVKLLKKMQEE